jgi:protein-S-isoprenylcysteine O-methyltransferase Ste14
MSDLTTARTSDTGSAGATLKTLVGAGDKIGRTVLPFLVVGVVANIVWPSVFSVGGPSEAVGLVAIAMLAVGLAVWAWSVVLILTKVPRHELITTGPFALMKHPLYTGVSLLVLPGAGLLLNTWLGIAIGLVIYIAARRYAPEEEQALASEFGAEWDAYAHSVLLPWL